MANHSSQPRGCDHGSARNYNGHDRDGSYSASCFANESSTHNHTTSHGTQTSHHRASRANEDASRYPNQGEDADNGQPRSQYGHYALQEAQYYHTIPRPYQTLNPEVYRVLHDPVLTEATARLGGRHRHHNRSSTRQQRPRCADHHRCDSHSPDPYHNSRPLGYSNLRNLNRDRSPRSAMRRRLNDDQRAGPYDNVREVNARSEYEERASYQCEQESLRYQEEGVYEGHDDRSETLR